MSRTACSLPLLLILSLVTTLFLSCAAASKDNQMGWMIGQSADKCKGSMGDCFENDEFEMSTESNRRILQATQYISYAALQANAVPCSHKGSSYYNCQPGASANPYSRGCSAIARCRH